MDRASKTEIIQALKEVALEASTLYSDEPLDYKKRPVTPKAILETGESLHNVDVVLATAKNSCGRKILDVGIAYGIYDVVLKRRFGFEICGIDHPENVNVYCKFPIREGITVLSCDLHRDVIPYPDGSFDTVIASEVAEHLLIPPKSLFSKINTVLKPGGKLIVTTPNFANLRNILLLITGNNPMDTFPDVSLLDSKMTMDMRVHPREYTVKEIRESLVAAGFDLCCVRTTVNTVKTSSSLKSSMISTLMRIIPKYGDKIVALAMKNSA